MVTTGLCPRCGGLGQVIVTPVPDLPRRGPHASRSAPTRSTSPPASTPARRCASAAGARSGPGAVPPATSTCTCGSGPTSAFARDGDDLVADVPIGLRPGRPRRPPRLRHARRRRARAGRAGRHPERARAALPGPGRAARATGGAVATCGSCCAIDTPTKLDEAEEELLRAVRRGRAGRGRRSADQGPVPEDQVRLLVSTLAEDAGRGRTAFVADLDAPVLDADDRHHLERVLRLRPGAADRRWPTGRGVAAVRGSVRALEPAGPVDAGAAEPSRRSASPSRW